MRMRRNNDNDVFLTLVLLTMVFLLTGCEIPILGGAGKNKALIENKTPITGKLDASGNTLTFSVPVSEVGKFQDIYGLKIDSMTNQATISINAKATAFDSYNRPIVEIHKIVLYENIPKNTKIHESRKVYDVNKNLLEIDEKNYTPLTPAEMYILKNSSMVVKESSPMGSFFAGAMGSAIPVGIAGFIWFIIKLFKYIPRILKAFKEEKKG